MTRTSFTERHAVSLYFALTYVISWGAIFLLGGPGVFLGDRERIEALLPLVYVAMLVGPSAAGILMAVVLHGRAGLREIGTRLCRWRVGVRWYAAALFTAPLLVTAVLVALSFRSQAFVPGLFASGEPASLAFGGVVAGLFVGFFEELGWTGFAIPRLRSRYGVLATGLIVGLLWGLWHFPLFVGSGAASGAVPPAVLVLVLLFSFLPAFRVLMVWVYDRTASLLVAVLMHLSLVFSVLALAPMTLAGVELLTYDLALAAALWAVVLAVALANGGRLAQRPPAAPGA